MTWGFIWLMFILKIPIFGLFGIVYWAIRQPADEPRDDLLRRALAYGTALASFNVEAFGSERMQTLTSDEVAGRVADLGRITRFEDAPVELRG